MQASDLREAREFVLQSGIYKITINFKNYVGSAVNFGRRKKKHKKLLNTNKHPNKHLQAAYNKYNEYEFVILERCEPENLLVREAIWIDWLKSYEGGYNKRRLPNSNLGLKFSQETRDKISKSNIGKHSAKRQPMTFV